MYDFDKILPRENTGSIKWDGTVPDYGKRLKYPLWVADADFPAPKEVIDAVQEVVNYGTFGYCMQEPSYNEALIGWFKRRFGVEYKTEWIVQTPGVVTILQMCAEAFTEPGDGIIVLHPIYTPFPSVAAKGDRREIPVFLKKAENGYRTIDFDALEEAAKEAKMLLLCNPHNPVSRVWTKDELRRVVEICKANDVLIVSDEIHIDLTSPDYPATPILSVMPEYNDRIVAATAPSKTFNLPGLHDSNAIIPGKELREKYQALHTEKMLPTRNTFVSRAVQAAYNHGDVWLDEVREYLKGNEALVREVLSERLPKIQLVPWEGTYLLWLDCTALGKSEEELKALLAEESVGFTPGAWYFSKEDVCFRMNMACSRVLLKEALEATVRALGDL